MGKRGWNTKAVLPRHGKERQERRPRRKSSLRSGYTGFCPLREEGGELRGGGEQVERTMWQSLDPSQFYDLYVRQRKPVVIKVGSACDALEALFGLRGEAASWARPGLEGTAAMRAGLAGACEVEVERRGGPSQFFGQQDAGKRETTTLGKFCDEIDSGSELMYLTTQALPEDARGCPTALAAPHVRRLLREAHALRPELIGQLAPMQYNLWFGRSAEGSSSGLHHDFHDNIYVLLRGRKEFRLFSPRCLDLLSPVGVARGSAKLHPNGLITYLPGLRSDGAPVSMVRSWQGGGASRGSSEEEEAELDQMLNEAREGQGGAADATSSSQALPDSFCHVSTLGTGGRKPVPASLAGRHLTADLAEGDLLYLPASWFHEVISYDSYGGAAGGHLALNLWAAPPRMGASFKKPYEDGFWEEVSCKLQRAAREEAGPTAAPSSSSLLPGRPKTQQRHRKKGKRPRALWTHRSRLPPARAR